MAIKRVKVGLPIDAPRGRSGMRWSGVPQGRERSAAGRAGRAQINASQVTAPANIAAKPLDFISARNFFVLALVALMTVFVVGLMVRSNHLAVSHSYEISELTQEKMDLLETNRQLKTELAEVASLENLETAARETLGLTSPRQGQIVVIE